MAAFAFQKQLHTFAPAKTAYRSSITCQADFLSRAVYGSVLSFRPALTALFRITNPNKFGSNSARLSQTRLFLGGRQPLCGIGVASRIPRTSRPAVASARTADSRPEPGPLTRTSTVRRPTSLALFAAVRAACCAANGVPLREPRKPSEPALDQEIVLPSGSEIVMIVLLNVAWTCTSPLWTTRFS